MIEPPERTDVINILTDALDHAVEAARSHTLEQARDAAIDAVLKISAAILQLDAELRESAEHGS